MSDDFFNKKDCDRCGGELKVRKLSWFNLNVLCKDCINKEDELKQKLRDKGVDVRSLEGCGYIPEE